ncbi:hypothetical protein CLOM621_06302 [Clostridium sp. M62/1]|nr:hypothetical protein CLOM621_06302 [Clostridium sp. M62/1]
MSFGDCRLPELTGGVLQNICRKETGPVPSDAGPGPMEMTAGKRGQK